MDGADDGAEATHQRILEDERQGESEDHRQCDTEQREGDCVEDCSQDVFGCREIRSDDSKQQASEL